MTKQKVLRYHETFGGGYAATLEIDPARLPHINIEWRPTVPDFNKAMSGPLSLLTAYRSWRDASLQDAATKLGLNGAVGVIEAAP